MIRLIRTEQIIINDHRQRRSRLHNLCNYAPDWLSRLMEPFSVSKLLISFYRGPQSSFASAVYATTYPSVRSTD